MGTIFRPVVTRPMPSGAEITERDGERTARWRNGNGKLCTAPVRTTPRGDCIVQETGKYLARYRDGEGVTQTIPTGCRDESAARAVLVGLEKRAELVRAGILSPSEDAMSISRREAISSHVSAYAASLTARGCTPRHVRSVKRRVEEVLNACHFRALKDIRRESVEKWLGGPDNAKRSARTRNTYLIGLRAFVNWAVETERMLASPLTRIPLADEKVDRRRVPRAFTEEELVRLLDAARRRPLAEAKLFNRGWRKGTNGAHLRPETIVKLETLGRERALIYKTLVLTGLRLGELSAIRVCDVERDHIVLAAKHEKNREGSVIPLRADLARDLRAWIDERRDGQLFAMSANLVKVFNRDLKFARIPKHDERGRTACVHGLRHSFASLLSSRGVAPRVAQAAMRHSTLDLTMTVYTDPKLLDVSSALNVLPELPLVVASEPAAATMA
jgi:integrase